MTRAAPFSAVPFADPAAGAGRDPVEALLDGPEGVLAVIAGVEGPSYRPAGAVMAILADSSRVGSLSSGCIESDLSRHGLEALAEGRVRALRYGAGSPFFDIRLPCGGGLDILLVPRPDRAILRELTERRARRETCSLAIDPARGLARVAADIPTGMAGGLFFARFLPPPRFVIFGKGPEAGTFAALVHSAQYPAVLLSPDEETLATAAASGIGVRHLPRPGFPEGLGIDSRTAVVLFFHDHDWEPPILKGALATDAFYIGAQGSRRAREARNATLREEGVGPRDIARLHGPVGLIPSTRDPRTLAVSVLAEILGAAA